MRPFQVMRMGSSGGGAVTDPYFANVISLLHFDGTNGSTTFTDQKSPTWTAAVDAQIGTSQVRYGTGGLRLPTFGNGAHAASSSITSVSSSAWTAEISGYMATALNTSGETRQLFRFVNASNFGMSLFMSCNTSGSPDTTHTFLRLFISSNGTSNNVANNVYSTAIAPGSAAWYEYAIQFTGTAYEVYFAGAKVLSVASTAAVCPFTSIQIGGNPVTAAQTFYGSMDEWRLTNGIARLSNPYTPTGPFPDA